MPPQNQDLSASLFPKRTAKPTPFPPSVSTPPPPPPPAPSAPDSLPVMPPPLTPSPVVPPSPQPVPPVQPTPVPPPISPPVMRVPMPAPVPQRRSLVPIILIVVIILIIGGVIYAYKAGLIPASVTSSISSLTSFGKTPYTKENMASEIVAGIGKIQTSSYALNLSIKAEPKDADATTLSVAVPTNPVLDQAYKRDLDRVRDMNTIARAIDTYYYKNKVYPPSLSSVDAGSVTSIKNFTYAPVKSAADFTLTTTFETSNAIDSFSASAKYSPLVINGKAVTASKESGGYLYLPSAPAKPAFFQLLNMQSYLSYIPGDFGLDGTVSGASQKTGEAINTKVRIAGAANVGDANFGVDVELRKVSDNYYFMLSKLPSLFMDVSKIKGKWIMITPDDLATYSSSLGSLISSREDAAKVKSDIADQIRLFFTIADKDGVLIPGSPKKETIDEASLYRYDLQFDKTKFAQFYTDLTSEMKNKYSEKQIFEFNQATFDYLNSPEFDQVFEYFRKNTTLTLWANGNGVPIQVSYSLRMVPESTKGPADHQVRLGLKLTLHDVNKSISIDAPDTSMSFEDASILLSGQTKEFYEIQKQGTTVATVKYALEEYKRVVGTYPESLSDLTKIQKPATTPILKTVPLDGFSHKPFTYSLKGSDFNLGYTIKLPPYKEGEYPSGVVTYSYIGGKQQMIMAVLEGQNTATSKTRSIEADAQSLKDSDGDGLPDNLEKYIGTNTLKKDTDGDGHSDSEELRSQTNPNGPGSLKVTDGRYSSF